MNPFYFISLLGILSAVGAACYWARMKPWRTTFHLIAAPVAIPFIGFTVYFGVAMPLTLISLGLESAFQVNIDSALESTATVVTSILMGGLTIAYFRSEKSYLKSTHCSHACRSTLPRLRKGVVPVCKNRKPIGDEYHEIRAKRFATGTVYILPRIITTTPTTPTPHLEHCPTINKLGPLYATARPKKPSSPLLDDSRFTWHRIQT